MQKLSTSLLALAIGGVLLVARADAAGSNCQIIYGGGESCPPSITFSVDKKVQTPGKGGQFVDNITVNDPKFSPGDSVSFQVNVQNTGREKISDLQVTDTLPGILKTTDGKSTFSYTIENLDPGKTDSRTFTVKLSAEKDLPANQGVVCDKNHVKAQKDAAVAEDSAQVCVEKKVLGAVPTPQVFQTPPLKQTPPTGPEMAVLPLLGGTGLLGMFLRKKSVK